jgi:arylsulfate sulfotransferase
MSAYLRSPTKSKTRLLLVSASSTLVLIACGSGSSDTLVSSASTTVTNSATGSMTVGSTQAQTPTQPSTNSTAVTNNATNSALISTASSNPTTTTTTTTTAAISVTTITCPQAENFPDVSLRSNYIDKNLDGKTVWDSDANLQPKVTVSCASGLVNVASNGVPNFDSVGNGRGGLDATYRTNQKTWRFPTNPIKAASTTSLTNVLGPVGVMVNGVQFYTPVEAPIDGFADAVKNGYTNFCGGHVDQYHFHGFPECFFNQTTLGGATTFLKDKTPGVIVGYAFDGFPVKVPYEACTSGADCVNGIREIVSAYQYTGTGSYSTEAAFSYNTYIAGYNGSTLDKCNGKTDSEGNYAYYATRQFPYYLACYTGTKTAQ